MVHLKSFLNCFKMNDYRLLKRALSFIVLSQFNFNIMHSYLL